MAHVSINKYRQVSINNVQDMAPYEQVKLILVNIVGKLAAVKGCIERKDIEKKGLYISNCISLIGALQTALNMDEGGEISENLASLYEYCQFKLVNANVENDVEGIIEVSNIIKNIKEGWDAIPQDVRQSAQQAATG
ncbi:flagellar export chaperone FliS [Pseudoalteromonas denitrificans]|uniref:Flagellar secretion chaperone FliS n=1 Tax=Pseudoalteromonas denitrificans DSM 6059 TaxID=1123010 RepID=A0A1I1HSA7_9GAMM|nr:flagellar export chaperone FliS [Pseudoalteromonas denitrificans]SFC23870.1 flagellar protein FliS [Pseudoalteromonas denitrificans DSM 6059]